MTANSRPSRFTGVGNSMVYHSKRVIEVLTMMRKAELEERWEDAEIVCDKSGCWLGDEWINRQVVNKMLTDLQIKQLSEPGAMQRYTINETGCAYLKDRSVLNRIKAALRNNIPVNHEGYPL